MIVTVTRVVPETVVAETIAVDVPVLGHAVGTEGQNLVSVAPVVIRIPVLAVEGPGQHLLVLVVVRLVRRVVRLLLLVARGKRRI